jgi:hypothetical protein
MTGRREVKHAGRSRNDDNKKDNSEKQAWPALLNQKKRARRITKIVILAIEYTPFTGENQERGPESDARVRRGL